MRAFITFIFIYFLTSCNPTPKPKIDIAKMSDIMLQMHYADGLATFYLPNTSNRRFVNRNTDSLKLYYGLIFKKYSITEKDFIESYKIYIKDPVMMDSIYKRVLDKINLEKAKEKITDKVN